MQAPDCTRCGGGTVSTPGGRAARVRVVSEAMDGEPVFVCRTCSERVYFEADKRRPKSPFLKRENPMEVTHAASKPLVQGLFD